MNTTTAKVFLQHADSINMTTEIIKFRSRLLDNLTNAGFTLLGGVYDDDSYFAFDGPKEQCLEAITARDEVWLVISRPDGRAFGLLLVGGHVFYPPGYSIPKRA